MDNIESIVEEKEQQEEPRYFKIEIMRTRKWRRYRDAVNVVLEDDKLYTLKEAEKIINEFLYRKVN